MSHVREETTLRDILLRQHRKSDRMKCDLEIYDRAKEGTHNYTYGFLSPSIHDLLTRERIRNRDKITRSHGDARESRGDRGHLATEKDTAEGPNGGM